MCVCVCMFVVCMAVCMYICFFSWVCLKDAHSNVCNIYHLHTSTVWWCLFIFKRIYKLYPPARQLPWFFWSVGGIFIPDTPVQHTQMNLSKIEWDIHNEVSYVENMASDFQPDVVVWFAVCRFPNAGVWFENDSRSIAATGKTRVQFAVEGNEFTCNAGLDGYWQCGQCGMIFTDPEDGELASVLPMRRDKTTLKMHEPLKRMLWKILVWFSLCWFT